MSSGSSNKSVPWTSGGAPGQGDGSHRLGRPRRSPAMSGQSGSPSMSADSTLSSKHATAKILDVPDDIEPQPMFPYQDPSYMERQRRKPQPMQSRKGVVLRLTRRQLREFVRDEFERDGLEISEEELNEFVSAIPRIAASLGRNVIGNVADDIAAPFLSKFVGKPAASIAKKLPIPASWASKITPLGAGKAVLISKELFGDLPAAIEEGEQAIAMFDNYMAQNPLGAGDAWTDTYFYQVEEPLRSAKFKILDNLVDIVERATAPGTGSIFRNAIKQSVKGTTATVAADQFDALRNALSFVGDIIPGDDRIEEAFYIVDELDARIDAVTSFKTPTGELGMGTTPGVTSMASPVAEPMTGATQGGFAMMEVKNLLREIMDEIPVGIGDGETVDEEPDSDADIEDEDVDEASSGGVAGFAAPLHYDPESGRRMKKMYSRHYKTVGPDLKPKP